jgi:hypothetical protein
MDTGQVHDFVQITVALERDRAGGGSWAR